MEYLLLDKDKQIGIIRLNRPEVLNALSKAVLAELTDAFEALDEDEAVRVIVLTGNDQAFAAGADLKALVSASSTDIIDGNTREFWVRMQNIRKPVIAAVSGYAFGGGCELAMICDLIIASETARFAQSEINVGIMPGAGGTQRLMKAIGQYKAMEMVLTGQPITADEAFSAGLVNRVVPVDSYLEEALTLARTIARKPPIAIQKAKHALRFGLETTLQQGLDVERDNYVSLYDTDDQNEGMQAFLDKRKPDFKGR